MPGRGERLPGGIKASIINKNLKIFLKKIFKKFSGVSSPPPRPLVLLNILDISILNYPLYFDQC